MDSHTKLKLAAKQARDALRAPTYPGAIQSAFDTLNEALSDIDLLPCPFCGGEPVVRVVSTAKGGVIRCENDECLRPKTTANTKQDAIVQWNTRSTSSEENATLSKERDEWKQAAQVEAGLRREFLARAEKAEAALNVESEGTADNPINMDESAERLAKVPPAVEDIIDDMCHAWTYKKFYKAFRNDCARLLEVALGAEAAPMAWPDEVLRGVVPYLDWDVTLTIDDEVKQLRDVLSRLYASPPAPGAEVVWQWNYLGVWYTAEKPTFTDPEGYARSMARSGGGKVRCLYTTAPPIITNHEKADAAPVAMNTDVIYEQIFSYQGIDGTPLRDMVLDHYAGNVSEDRALILTKNYIESIYQKFWKKVASPPAPVAEIKEVLSKIAPAVENLTNHQEIYDRDGVMVKVSRQALDEVLNAIALIVERTK